jgi:hypothetical protein
MPAKSSLEAPRPAACKYCRTEDGPVRLVPPSGGDALYVCPRCLRSLLLRKADLSQRRSELLLEAWAEENGLQVWCSDDVAYALPPVPARA